jgi:peptide/nickel transport system substrate-binding protein
MKTLQHPIGVAGFSRRDFVSQAAAIGVVGTAATGLWGKSASTQEPKKGGTLRVGVTGGSVSDSLDPALNTAAMSLLTQLLIRNTLVELDPQGEPIGDLVESWEPAPDASRWLFRIRRGVEFHNGKTLDAEDVIYSLAHHQGEDSTSSAKEVVKPIVEMVAEDAHTIVFSLDSAIADFPVTLSDPHLTITPAGTDFEEGIGTGGYTLTDYSPGMEVLARRFPNYWKDGRAHFDEVMVVGIADPSARINALLNGQIDVAEQVDFKLVDLLERSGAINIISVTGTQHYTFAMSTKVPPFDNLDVRMALKYAVDRQELLGKILNGYGMVGNDHPIAPGQRFFASDLPQRSYDPEKARWHIERAGAQDHVFTLHTSTEAFSGAVDAAILFKEQAARAGITIEVEQEPADGYWRSVWRKVPWCAVGWRGRPTEDWMFTLVYSRDSNYNDTGWANPKFNELLEAARGEIDNAKRRAMYREMQQLVRDDGATIIPLFANHVMATSDKVAHGTIAPDASLDGYRAPERWWFV